MEYTRQAMRDAAAANSGPWIDTMQVCLEGHVITESLTSHPEFGKAFCPKDGTATISECPTYTKPIPGRTHNTGAFVFSEWAAPERCEHCGSVFPWTGKKGDSRSSQVAVDEALPRLFERFDSVVRQLRHRREGPPTLSVGDEYDVQDLFHALLRVYWDDVRPEEWTPSYAGKAARVDFLLPAEQCVVEVKMTRPTLTAKQLGDELIIDIARYASMTSCKRLYCFVYDPAGFVANARGLESDLAKRTTKVLQVKTFIRPI